MQIEDSKLVMLRQLADRGSMLSLRNSLKEGALDQEQTFVLAWVEILKKGIVTIDTGLGKTYVAFGLMNIGAKLENAKWLVVIEKSNLKGWKSKAKKLTHLNCVFVESASDANIVSAFRSFNSNVNVMVVTYECLLNRNFINYFLYTKDLRNVIYDESDKLSHFSSITHKVARSMTKYMKRVIELNATPIITSPEQAIAQYSVLHGKSYKSELSHYVEKDLYGKESYINLTDLEEFCFPYVIGYSRKEIGVSIRCKPFRLPMDEKQRLSYLKRCYEKFKGKKIIVYADRDKLKDEINCTYGTPIVDGRNPKQRDFLVDQYNNTEETQLVLNVTKGVDLEADVVIYYELTYDWYQFLGRSVRGRHGKAVDVIWFITDFNYFNDKILERAKLLNVFNEVDLSALDL